MTDLAKDLCNYRATTGTGCPDPMRPAGTCGDCRAMVKLATDAARPVFEAQSFDHAGVLLAAAGGAQCFICRRQPWPATLTYKNLSVCALCAPYARQGEIMNDVSEAEESAGMAAIDKAGEYLASIDKFDLRDLTDDQLKKFNAHFITGFSESLREHARSAPPF